MSERRAVPERPRPGPIREVHRDGVGFEQLGHERCDENCTGRFVVDGREDAHRFEQAADPALGSSPPPFDLRDRLADEHRDRQREHERGDQQRREVEPATDDEGERGERRERERGAAVLREADEHERQREDREEGAGDVAVQAAGRDDRERGERDRELRPAIPPRPRCEHADDTEPDGGQARGHGGGAGRGGRERVDTESEQAGDEEHGRRDARAERGDIEVAPEHAAGRGTGPRSMPTRPGDDCDHCGGGWPDSSHARIGTLPPPA